MDSASSLSSIGGGTLKLYTAKRFQNNIQGSKNLNGQTFSTSTYGIDSTTEFWSVYYASSK